MYEKGARWTYGSKFLLALRGNAVDTVAEMLKDEVVDCNDEFYIQGVHMPAIALAIEGGSVEMVKVLHDSGSNLNQIIDSERYTPLHVAVKNGNVDMVKFLLQSRAKINAVTKDGQTPLCMSCWVNNTDIITLLVDNKADVELATSSKVTPLMNCCLYRNLHAVEYLLRHGANVNAIDHTGNNALFYASDPLLDKIDMQIVDILIMAGVNINHVNDLGESVLSASIYSHGALLRRVSTSHHLLELLESLLKNGFDIERHGFCALFRASLFSCVDAIDVLIRSGCNLSPSSGFMFQSVLYNLARYRFFPQIELMFMAGLDIKKEPWVSERNLNFNKLPPEVKNLLMNKFSEVPFLQSLCRRSIRKKLGYRVNEKIALWKNCPKVLKKYLLYH
ncbi:Ankyrin repeat domain-containing protein 17 [Nymphon striatum]|nr:Ankyrin repeat domain-containing protein 17 [Nymphon striatum]